MKPTLYSVRTIRRQDAFQSASKSLPVTDCNYQVVMLDGSRGGCAKAIRPSFRSISSDYFNIEARHNFAGEAAFFAMIVITAALPMLNTVHAMADFVRAIGGV